MSAAARRYAGALLGVSQEKGATDEVARDLRLVSDAFADESVQAALTGPGAAGALGVKLVEKASEGRHELVRNLLQAIARRQRLSVVPQLADTFDEMLRESRGETTGEVVSSQSLDESTTESLRQLAKSLSGRDVHLTFREDPSLLGGVRLRIGNTLYDGSAVRSLELLRQKMLTAPIG